MPFNRTSLRNAFLAGDYPRCRELLAQAPQPLAEVWLGKIDYRLERLNDALHRLLSASIRDKHLAAERDAWLAAAYAATGELRLAHQLTDRALEVLAPPDEVFYRARYSRALAFYYEREYDAALESTAPLFESADANDRALAHTFLGWVHVRRENAGGHLNELLAALREFESAARPDEYALGHVLTALAVHCRERAAHAAYDPILAALARLHRTEGNALSHFLTSRDMGWVEALRGDEMSAMRRWRAAATGAPNDFWRVFCLTDRAYLASAMRREKTAREALSAANDLASRLNWSTTQHGERVILLTIAQLYAPHEPAIAQRYLAAFRSLSTHMHPRVGWVHDRRLRALQLFPQGVALLHLGEPDAARRMLEEAYDIFDVFEYRWRAALSAFELYKATRERRWLAHAREQIVPWPQSWIAREVRNAR